LARDADNERDAGSSIVVDRRNAVKKLFAVTRTRGGAWKSGVAAEQQFDWRGHIDYVRSLHAEGFVILAGSLDGTDDALLIVRAQDELEVKQKLEWDSWTANDLLRTTRVVPWTIRVGSLERE
jgi:uncharacterized protein YciI